MGRRVIRCACLIAWMPPLLEEACSHLIPRFEERVPATILIIPYIEFVTVPLTAAAAILVLYKTVRAVKDGLRNKPSKSSGLNND
jgi:hypothetical protein